MAKNNETAEVETTPAAPQVAHNAGFEYHKLNTLAVVSIATAVSWVGAVAGVITGHIALAQIKRTGEKGRALALTGLILGYLYIAGTIAYAILALLLRLRGISGGDDFYQNHTMGGWSQMNQNGSNSGGMMNFNGNN